MTEVTEINEVRDLSANDRYAVILNGPPGVGKDTLADRFLEQFPSWGRLSFKEQLYMDVCEHYGLRLSTLKRDLDDRVMKETNYIVTGMSPREMMIHVSENIIKPKLGKNYYGKVTGENGIKKYDKVIVTDGGFIEEIEEFNKYYGNLLIVRLYREGFTFQKDSREYINPMQYPSSNLVLYKDEIALGLYSLMEIVVNFYMSKEGNE